MAGHGFKRSRRVIKSSPIGGTTVQQNATTSMHPVAPPPMASVGPLTVKSMSPTPSMEIPTDAKDGKLYQYVILREDQFDIVAERVVDQIMERIDKRVEEIINAKLSYLDD